MFLSKTGTKSLGVLSEEAKQEHMKTQENECTGYGKSPVVAFVGSGCDQLSIDGCFYGYKQQKKTWIYYSYLLTEAK